MTTADLIAQLRATGDADRRARLTRLLGVKP